MYSIKDFFENVWCFIRHIPDAILFTIAYLIFGVRPYRIMTHYKTNPLSEPSFFSTTLLPSGLSPFSIDAKDYALSHLDKAESILLDSFCQFERLDPMPFFDYLWNDVLMPSEFFKKYS